MAIDYIVGSLQLLSVGINALALSAFWASPGLRTTSNRFVINLLFVNIVGCLALTPALWLHGGLKTTFYNHSGNSISDHHTNNINNNKSDINTLTEQEIARTMNGDGTTNRPFTRDESSTIATTDAPSVLEEMLNVLPVAIDDEKDLVKSYSAHLHCSSDSSDNDCEGFFVAKQQQQQQRKRKHNRVIEKFNEKKFIRTDVNDEIDVVEETDDERTERIANGKMRNSSTSDSLIRKFFYTDCTRFWGLDFTAALGALSVVLVVGDTWCAVTDPLRYHTRISGPRTWILIGFTWILSIVFCIASAIRRECLLITTETRKATMRKYIFWSNKMPSLNSERFYSTIITTITDDSTQFYDIYNFAFSCIYFIIIILVPILLVCIMYWNIFSEARKSGIRMRRNGSSPLLQSSMNLAQMPRAHTTHQMGENVPNPYLDPPNQQNYFEASDGTDAADAIVMKIDSEKQTDSSAGRDNKSKGGLMKIPAAIGTQYRRYLEIPKILDKNHNNILTPLGNKHSSMHRNTSSHNLNSMNKDADTTPNISPPANRHKFLSQMLSSDMRQVHSSPNLQKLSNHELLHKAACCKNARSSININHNQHHQHHHSSNSAKSYMTTIRHRLSNASSIFKYREESRAARISILVVIMFLISYFPYGLLVLLQGHIIILGNTSLLCVLLLLIANTSSPFIFAYRNRRVRRGVCRLFGVDDKTNNYLQKQRMILQNNNNLHHAHNKHVRIHGNLSSSNYSLNLMPYKYASTSILPQDSPHSNHSILHNSNSNNNGPSALFPIDDEDTESSEPFLKETGKSDLNTKRPDNETISTENATNVKEKISFLKRVCKTSKKLSNCTASIQHTEAPLDQQQQQHHSKTEAIV